MGDSIAVDIARGKAARFNNPGNLVWAGQSGAMPDRESGEFAQFRTPEAGMAALERDIRAKQSGSKGLGPNASLRLFVQVWLSGRGPAEVNRHVSNIAYMLRDWDVTENTPIGKIPSWALADAVAWAESHTTVARAAFKE